jgi:hypothetical protein
MGKRLGAGIVCFALAAAIGGQARASDPLTKCQVAKLKAAGKKLAAKLGCYSKAKTKPPFTVDPACLMKAEATFTLAMTRAGNLCRGTTAAVEAAIDACVGSLTSDAPANTKCDASSVKAMGKGGASAFGCVGKDLSKPGTGTGCLSTTLGSST